MDLIERIIKEGERRVAELEVCLSSGYAVTGRLKRREIHYASGSEHQGLSLRVIHEGRIGTSATSNPERWEECLDAAISSARLATPQNWKGLPGPGKFDHAPLNFDPAVIPDPGTARGLLEGLIEGAEAYPVEITSATAEVSQSSAVLANSSGIRYSERETMVSVGIEAIIGQSTGYEFDASCRMDIDPRKVGEKAAYLAYASQDGKDIKSDRYDVVLSPVALSQILGSVFVPALSGKNVHAGRSRLAGLLSQEVMDPSLSLIDDPLNPKGISRCRWDGEGTPARRIGFVEEGILSEFAYDLKTAYRYGKESTGSAVRGGHGGSPSIGVHVLSLDGPRCNVSEDEVVHVHDVVGAHTANPLSGDFSVELSNAFFMREGNVEFPVRKAMLSGNVFEMLMETAGLSRDERVIGSMVLPEIRLKNLALIGN
ncbi:MAG: peptidase PmbA [Methanoregulaceae archaeon PtaB.Bin056]|nr:MAG: peptidase PmbA [Methanoregulaceae archaeon PtaB.Bin056]